MKKSQLIKLIKEELANKQTTPTGYEKKDGKLVPHFDKFDSAKLSSILTRIAKKRPEEVEENSKKVSYTKKELEQYLNELPSETKVKIPNIFPGGFSAHEKWVTTAEKALAALKNTSKEGKFTQDQDTPNYKDFSLVQTPEQMKARERAVRGAGPLD